MHAEQPAAGLRRVMGMEVLIQLRCNINRWSLLFPIMAGGILLFFKEVGPGPGSLFNQISGFGHLLFFALMAWALSRWCGLDRRSFLFQSFCILLVIFFVGGAIELIQPYFGRNASWRDLRLDLLGGLLGLVFLGPARRQLRQGFLVGAQFFVLGSAVVVFHGPAVTLWDMWQASRQFPVLSDFETRQEVRRWSRGEVVAGPARHGDSALSVSLGTERYAGTSLLRGFGDWRGYQTFSFSLYNPDDDPVRMTVSIRDQEHFRRGSAFHDRFNRGFTMEPGWNDISIPVADIQNAPSDREMSLDSLMEVVIFAADLPAPRQVYLDYVRLER